MKKTLKILLTTAALVGCALLMTSCKDKGGGVDSRTYPAASSLSDDGTVEFSADLTDVENDEVSENKQGIQPADAESDIVEPSEAPAAEEIDRGVAGQNLEDDFDVGGGASSNAERRSDSDSFPGEDYTDNENLSS